MPTISPARRSSDTLPAAARPARRARPARWRAAAPRRRCARGAPATRPRCTWRPTIASASASIEVSAIGVSSTTAPWRITVTSSHSAMISFSLCVISRIVVPRSRRPRSTTNSCSVSCGVSTAVGSSRIRMRAPRYSALRISRRWRSPTGSSATTASRSTARPVSRISASSLARTCAARGRQAPRWLGAEHDVVERGEGVDQHEVLVHHADAQRDRVVRVADAAPACLRPRSRRCRPCRSRTGSTSACSCRRRSRRRCHAPCRRAPSDRRRGWRARRRSACRSRASPRRLRPAPFGLRSS